MKLIWHLAKKDLRHQWPSVLVYAVFLLLKLGIGAVLIWRDEWPHQDVFGQFTGFAGFLAAIEIVVAYLLVAAIVHEDPLVGSRGFWMTKPISGLRLLGAKLVALFLVLGVLPLLLTWPWWIACGLSPVQTVAAVGRLWLENGALVLLAMPVAVLTSTSSRFLLGTLLGLATWVVTVFPRLFSADAAVGTISPGVASTRFGIIAGLVILGGIGITLHQYRTRHTRRSAGLLASIMAAIIATAWIWPWDWSSNVPHDADESASIGRNIVIELKRAELTNGGTQVQLWLAVTGVPSGWSLLGTGADSLWTWRDGLRFSRSRQPLLGTTPAVEAAAAPLVQTAVPAPAPLYHLRSDSRDRLADPRDLRLGLINELFTTSHQLPRSFADRFSASPALDLSLRFALAKPKLTGESDASIGSRCTTPEGNWRVIATTLSESQREMTLVRWAFAPRNAQNPLSRWRSEYSRQMLINSSRGVVVFGERGYFQSVSVAGVAISWQATHFDTPQPAVAWLRGNDWAEGTRLVLLDYRPEGVIQRQLKLESLTVEQPSPQRPNFPQ